MHPPHRAPRSRRQSQAASRPPLCNAFSGKRPGSRVKPLARNGTGTSYAAMDDLAVSAYLPERFDAWFAGRGWAPRAHQLAMVDKARAGRDALLIAPTGGGKTLAGFLPSLIELC